MTNIKNVDSVNVISSVALLQGWDDSCRSESFCRRIFPFSNGHALGDGWHTKYGITFVMWIAIPFQENKGLLQNNVRRYASWILMFLDILKIIGNS